MAGQYFANLKTNLRNFLTNDFHMKSGMKYLIESFYRSILEDGPVPIPHREILLTARIMDDIFVQLDQAPRLENRESLPLQPSPTAETVVRHM